MNARSAVGAIVVEESAADGRCCDRPGTWGRFHCAKCADMYCYLHATFRYGTRYCPRCQVPLECRSPPEFDDGLLIDPDGANTRFDLASLDDSLNPGGSLRFLLELLHQCRVRGVRTCAFAWRGGGIWADKHGDATDGMILGDGTLQSVDRALDYLVDRGVTRLAVNHWNTLRAMAGVKRRPGLQIIAHVHCEFGALSLAKWKDLALLPDRLVFPSDATCRLFLDATKSLRFGTELPVIVFPNCVPRHVVNGGKRTAAASEPEPIITVLSRIDPRKLDLGFFLSVLEALQRTHPHHVVEFAGFGSEFHALREGAERMGLTNAIRFLGFVDDIAGFLERGLVSFLPSRSESCPYAWLEAAWLRRRTVVPDAGIFTELPANGMLYKFEPQIVSSAVTALRSAIDAVDQPPLQDWPPRQFVDREAWARTVGDLYDL